MSETQNHSIQDKNNETNTADNIDEDSLTPNTVRRNENDELNYEINEINLAADCCVTEEMKDIDSEGAGASLSEEVTTEDMSLRGEQMSAEEVIATNNLKTENDHLERQPMESVPGSSIKFTHFN